MVTFEAGSRFSTNASIPIISDSENENDEQFRAKFELPSGYRNLNKGDPEEAVITIEDVVTGWAQSVCLVILMGPTVDPLHILLYCMYTLSNSKNIANIPYVLTHTV